MPGDNLDVVGEDSFALEVLCLFGPFYDVKSDWVLLLEDILGVNVYPFLVFGPPGIP